MFTFSAANRPSNKPVRIEDQIVTDENGKRRFHGAFTGGFSAGYWNTVGSKEGWKPTQFKSTKSNRSEIRKVTPSEFMDEEDLSEFGFAPQRVTTQKDFTQENTPSSASAQLNVLFQPIDERIAIRCLRKLGWREGQGIGERQTTTQRKHIIKRRKLEHPDFVVSKESSSSDNSDNEAPISLNVLLAPKDIEEPTYEGRHNTNGLGYKPELEFGNIFGGNSDRHVFNLKDQKSKKTMQIRGQAFGIGAFEDDDDVNVYESADFSQYDYALTDASDPSSKSTSKSVVGGDDYGVKGFVKNTDKTKPFKKVHTSFEIPKDWRPKKIRVQLIDRETALRIEANSSQSNTEEKKSRPSRWSDVPPPPIFEKATPVANEPTTLVVPAKTKPSVPGTSTSGIVFPSSSESKQSSSEQPLEKGKPSDRRPSTPKPDLPPPPKKKAFNLDDYDNR